MGMTSGPVWGLDPSTKRIALARTVPGSDRLIAETRSLEQGGAHRGARLSRARNTLMAWFRALEVEHGIPGVVALEQPMGRAVPVVSLELQGIILCALWDACPVQTRVVLVPPPRWKKVACGKGNIAPADYLAYARTHWGYRGDSEDEAAALAICVWAQRTVV